MNLYSRAGKNTVNTYYEFVKAAAKRSEKLQGPDVIKAKIKTGLAQADGQDGGSKCIHEQHKKTIDINMKMLGDIDGFEYRPKLGSQFNATQISDREIQMHFLNIKKKWRDLDEKQ